MEPSVPLWYMPAPPGYPWTNMVLLPTGCTPEDGAGLVEMMKQMGNDSLRQGNSYDALWKYVHALELSRNLNLASEMAVLHGNCAQACLNLELYPDVYIHASNCVLLDPNSDKAFFRRAEAIRRAMVSGQGIPSYLGVENIISDYIQCHRIKQNARALCEAIIVAVDHKMTKLLPILVDRDVQSGFCTKLFQEMVSNPGSQARHIQFLIFDMRINTRSRQPFDCSTVRLSDLIKKKVTNTPLLIRLFDCGLQVLERDFAVIVSDLPDSDSSVEILDLILTRYPQTPEVLDKPCQVAMKTGKKQIGSCFLKHGATAELEPQELVAKIKEDGNSLFKEGNYHEALGKYYRALEICSKQGCLEKEMAVIRGNCAQVCLNLKLFKDAYEHANESIELNPQLEKSYYRRAEALKSMLQSPELKARVPPMKSIADAVQDYCRVKRNSTALVEAIILAVNHHCTPAIAKMKDADLDPIAPTLLKELLERKETKLPHIQYLLFNLYVEPDYPLFDASGISLSSLLARGIRDEYVTERLMELGAVPCETDCKYVIDSVPDSKESASNLRVLLSKLKPPQSVLQQLCKKAMSMKKTHCIAALIEGGAEPDPTNLKRAIGWPHKTNDPVFRRYFKQQEEIDEFDITGGMSHSGGLHGRPYYGVPPGSRDYPFGPPFPPGNHPPGFLPGEFDPRFGYSRHPPPPPKNDSDPLEIVKILNDQGKKYWSSGDYPNSLEHYGIALDVCMRYKLKQELPIVHGNLARVYLKVQMYQQAYVHASHLIALNPLSAKGYFRRAEALKQALSSGGANVPSALSYADAVIDYCQSHRVKASTKALCEAIVIGVDHDCAQIMFEKPVIEVKHAQTSFCNKLFDELLSRSDCKQEHLKFLVLRLLANVPFSATTVNLSKVLQVPVSNRKLIRRLIDLNMEVKESDIKTAVEILADTSSDVLNIIISAREGQLEHVDSYLYTAARAKKLKIVSCLLELGADPSAISFDLVTHALEKKDESTAKQLWQILKPGFDPNKVNICTLIATSLADYPEFVSELLDAGVNPNGSGKKKPLLEVIGLSYLSPAKRNHLISILLEKGADCNQLCLASKSATTPLHIVTKFALEAVNAGGDTSVIDALVASPTFTPPGRDGRVVDANGKTPFHIAIQNHFKREVSVAVLTSLIKTHKIPVSPFVKDKVGKQAKEYIHKKDDERFALLEKAAAIFSSSGASGIGKSKKKKKKKSSQSQAEESSRKEKEEKPATAAPPKSPTTEEAAGDTDPKKPAAPQRPHYEKSSLPQKLEIHMKKLLSITINPAYFTDIPMLLVEEEEVEYQEPSFHHISKSRDISPHSLTRDSDSQSQDGMDHKVLIPCDTAKERQATPSTTSGSEMEDVAEAADISELFSQYGFHNFDELPWEVEVTSRVKKFLKDEKNNSKALRVSVVRTIFQLAEGQRGTHLAKAVSGVPSLHLYRAKMNKGGRILWEKAIQFSPRQTHSHKAPIYSQVIRIWDIVPNHDHLTRCIEQVESSFKRGNSAAINFSLLPQETNKCEPVRSREQLEIPKTFLLRSDLQELVLPVRQQFIPAASMKEDEYNVTYFYSFSSAMVKSVLIGGEHRRDFPFKEWPKEHEIINLQIKESILLLGRSGTGKTTCCLYRLWNEFKLYWDPEVRHPDSKLPRKPLISGGAMEELMVECPEEYEEKEGEKEEEEESAKFATGGSTSSLPTTHSCSTISCSPGVDDKGFPLFEDVHVYGEDESSKHAQQSESSPASEQQTDTQEFPLVFGADEVLENLHQVFITKNYVLCAQMKRRFFDMAAAHDFLNNHLKFEKEDIPFHLRHVDDWAYPLFLTARQFYILLDNSLEDGKNFFPRADDGTLKVKIISSDYDHEDVDTLLDLEQSDDEDGDEDLGREPVAQGIQPKQATSKSVPAKWMEVTSLYFKECVWPAIAHKCGEEARSFDPLLVWTEIQSFIKGSEGALRKGSPLTIDEYQVVGNRMAPNFADQRECIYKAFLHYEEYCQNQRHSMRLFDECDLVQQLYHRLCQLKDVCWSIHCFFIDEVQDFTQAELALFLHCCRDPNSNFFTGDTAQSIMRGIAFRFQDLRSLFYRIHRKVPLVRVPHKPFTLTINFRSHSGILKMAGSVIDLLTGFFHGSIDDNLPEDKGMFPGPTPVLIESCEVSDLALLLSSNKREASAIEFGCHQIILVQSKEAKEKLPDILQGAIVLTIFEAKGLEFDDVLLYNFFTDSLVDEKSWRVVTSYLQQNPTCVVNDAKVPGTTKEPRSLEFDEKRHKSLSAELKYLYTAITRAKCNLWIYDSHKERRLPMFNYWYKRNLVKVVGAGEGLMEGEHSIIFASISTEDQWKVQGDYFKKKHLWEQARHCYLKSGEEYAYLALEAKARILIQQGRQQGRRQCYLEAAVCFFECDNSHHNVSYLKSAALCLMNTQPPKYSEAAKLFERLGERARAFKAFKKARDAENCARLREEDGRFTETVRILDHFNKKLEALEKAADFEKRAIEIEPDVTVNELSYTYAKKYAASKDKRMLCDVLGHMTDIPRRARFYKEGGLFEKAFEVYKSQKQFNEAFRLATAQMAANHVASTSKGIPSEQRSAKARKAKEWNDRATFLAEAQKDEKMKVMIFFQALKLQFDDISTNPTFFESDEGKELERVCKSYKDQDIQAQAKLLMCRLSKDGGICRASKGTYKLLRHKIGELEAFAVSVQLNEKESLRTVLNMCHLAAETGELLSKPNNSANAKQVTQQALAFFNLQKVGVEYVIPQGQEAWLGELFKGCEVKEKVREKERYLLDLDGMLRLQGAAVRSALVKHYRNYENEWFKKFEQFIRSQIRQHFASFPPHKEIDVRRSLSRVYSSSEIVLVKLTGYVENCILDCEVSVISKHCGLGTDRDIVPRLLRILTLFSPQVSLFLPLRKDHVIVVRRSLHMNDLLRKWIGGMLKEAEKRDRESFDVNLWLLLWRACCLVDGDMTVINKSLDQQAQNVNNEAEKFYNKDSESQTSESPTKSPPIKTQSEQENYQSPPAFLYWRRDDRYEHLFTYWLQSCTFIKKGQASYSSRCVVKYFLGTNNKANISVMNLVDIFALHCTSLLAILTHINAIRAFQTHFRVPFLYKRIVQLFDDLNVHTREDKFVMVACSEEVVKQRFHQRLIDDCQYVLRTMLDILLGYYNRFRILSYAFKHEDSLKSGAACHCLILTLTIFGNLILVRSRPPPRSKPHRMEEYQQRLCAILDRTHRKPNAPEFVREAFQALNSADFRTRIFPLITSLLQRSDKYGRLVYLQLKAVPNKPPRVCFIEPDRFRPQPHGWSQQQQQQPSHHASHNVMHSPTFPNPSLPPRMAGSVPASGYPTSVPGSPPSAQQPHYIQQSPPFVPYAPPLASAEDPFIVTAAWQLDATQPITPFKDIQMTQIPVVTEPPIFPTGGVAQQPGMLPMGHSTAGYSHPSGQPSEIATGSSPYDLDQVASGSEAATGDRFPEQEQLEKEMPERDEGGIDEDLNQALSRAQRSKVQSVQDEMSDATVIDSTFCYVCHVPLRLEVTHSSEEDDTEAGTSASNEPVVDQSVESYHSHIKSDGHKNNVKLFNQSKEEEKRYEDLVKEVGEMLAKCQSIEHKPSTLARVLDDMDEQRVENERKVAELTENRAYTELIEEIGKMCDRMHSRLKHAELEYTKLNLSSQESQDRTKHVMADVDDDVEDFLPELDPQLSEDLQRGGDKPVSSGATAKTLRSGEDKMQSREKKRKRNK